MWECATEDNMHVWSLSFGVIVPVEYVLPEDNRERKEDIERLLGSAGPAVGQLYTFPDSRNGQPAIGCWQAV